ncbi:MAG: hypothetical protein FADNKDHG_01556 [Holosporales bacterium]
MKNKLKEMMVRNHKLWTFFVFLFFCNFSFGTEAHKEKGYPSLRFVLSLIDEDKKKVLPIFDKKNPYEFIFDCFINDNKINKQEITSIKDALVGIKCDEGQKKQRIQKFFLLNLVSDDMDQDPICVSVHDEAVIKRDNFRKEFQAKTSKFLDCFCGEDKIRIKQKIDLYNDLLKLDEKQDLKDYKDLSKNINIILLKKNIFQDYKNWFEYLINWLSSIQKEEKLSAVVDGLLEINGKFMSTTVIDRLPSMLSIVNVLGILTTAVIFLNANESDVVNNKNIYTVNGNLTARQLLNYAKEECLSTAYKFSSIFLKNTTDYLNNTVENYFYNMTCLGLSQAYTYKYRDLVFFVVAIPFLSSFI